MVRQALGKGLDALIPSIQPSDADDSAQPNRNIAEVEVARIRRNPYQPRQTFDQGKIEELARSVAEKGFIQPIIVRQVEDGYELIAGERRFRAARHLKMEKIPVIVTEASDSEILELALIENIQRDDLNPMDCAQAFKQLSDEFNLTQEQIAQRVGKERASVANYMRLNTLSDKIQNFIRVGKLSFGHAKALMGVKDENTMQILAALVVKEGLSVRECERLVAGNKGGSVVAENEKEASTEKAPQTAGLDYQMESIQERFQQVLGTKVRIHPKKNGGAIEIQYYSPDDLHRILNYFDFDEEEF
jgi:ParB family transcriptional regulator, chromosome partitioning protein